MIHQIATKAGRPARASPMGPLEAFKYVRRTNLTVVVNRPCRGRVAFKRGLAQPGEKESGLCCPAEVTRVWSRLALSPIRLRRTERR